MIVSCLRVPRSEKYYVCFTSSYEVIQSDKFLRSRVPPPPPPKNVCRVPDAFHNLGSPSAFASAVGVPCRLTVPCVVYRKIGDREVAEPSVNDDLCREVMESIPSPENTVGYPTWYVINLLMDIAQHHTAFGSRVYRMCVFIGRRRAYPAPWTATRLIYDTMRALIDLGYLDRRFETEIVEKYNALEISSIIAQERFGKIHYVGFNFYEYNGRYEAIAMFWVGSDAVARRYALRLWDLHFDYTMRIIELMNSLPDPVKLRVENYRNAMVLGVPYWRTYFEVKGYSVNDIPRIVRMELVEKPLGVRIEDLGAKFYLVMKRVLEEVLDIEEDLE